MNALMRVNEEPFLSVNGTKTLAVALNLNADAAGATGWVRNEFDGSVTMEVQGTEEQIDRVILAVENGAYIRIENMESKTIPVDPGERRFTTKY